MDDCGRSPIPPVSQSSSPRSVTANGWFTSSPPLVAPANVAVLGPVYPPSRHFQRTVAQPAKRAGVISLARLQRPQSDARDVAGGGRVYPPIPPARASQRLRQDSALRIPV